MKQSLKSYLCGLDRKNLLESNYRVNFQLFIKMYLHNKKLKKHCCWASSLHEYIPSSNFINLHHCVLACVCRPVSQGDREGCRNGPNTDVQHWQRCVGSAVCPQGESCYMKLLKHV